MLNRFSRTEVLIGKDSLEKLKNAKVAIFGIGGVGSYVLEGLVRAGVGNFVLVDKDDVDITNINKKSIRQPGIHTIIDPEQIFFHLTGASCPNSVEQTRNPGRTTGTNTAKGALIKV